MQVSGQNNQTVNQPQPQYNSAYNCVSSPVAGTQAVSTQPTQAQTTQTQTAQAQPTQQQGYYYAYPQYNYYGYPQSNPGQVQIPASTAGVNIQIINPAVNPPGYCPYPPCCPTCPSGQTPVAPTTATTPPVSNEATGEADKNSGKKTEKRKVVLLTDDYIKNLESYLNSQDKNIRLSAAKEVFDRLEEDNSRFDDKALIALINKMLQDPSDSVRFTALTALDSRLVNGDAFTVQLLKDMQKSDKFFGQDAIDASRILLKMSGQRVEKEVDVTNEKKKGSKNPLYDE